jgi:hypothetical protein
VGWWGELGRSGQKGEVREVWGLFFLLSFFSKPFLSKPFQNLNTFQTLKTSNSYQIFKSF